MILNLTQHPATPEQQAQGVVDISDPEEHKKLLEALTFDEIPSMDEMDERAETIGLIVRHFRSAHPECRSVMIGGAPFFDRALHHELVELDFSDEEIDEEENVYLQVLYAFSRRESVERKNPDGSVQKINVFRHVGFVPAWIHYENRNIVDEP